MLETLKFIFPSDFAEARRAQKKVISAVQQHGYDADSVFAIQLALEEAVINAIKHGNKFDRKKNVTVEALVSDDRVEISVEDEGCGFDRACVPDPLAEENIERLHGRGLLLMEAYMDDVRYSKGGRRVHLLRLRREPPATGTVA
ncbi:MAG: ATP-binding protein [Tepidisphaeraceae bacterium]|jgi:serine/threonine-protein kinase RsbW